MTDLLLLSILWGFCCALVGVVYAVVLAGGDSPLNGWFYLINEGHERGGWVSWIAGPLGGCAKCFSGQLALWSSSILFPWALCALSVALHIFAACSAVLFATVLSYGYRWLKRKM